MILQWVKGPKAGSGSNFKRKSCGFHQVVEKISVTMEKSAVWAIRYQRIHPREALINIQKRLLMNISFHTNTQIQIFIKLGFTGSKNCCLLCYLWGKNVLNATCAFLSGMPPVVSSRAVTYPVCLMCRDLTWRATRHLGFGCCKDSVQDKETFTFLEPSQHLHSLERGLHWFS